MSRVKSSRAKSPKAKPTKYELHKKANDSGQYDMYMAKHGLTERSRAYYAKRHEDRLNSDSLFAQVHCQARLTHTVNKELYKADMTAFKKISAQLAAQRKKRAAK
jgi:hypothetical protein